MKRSGSPTLLDGRFTVIIPARNAASTIGRCIDSVLALDPPASSIIVVDDASTDETGAMAASKHVTVIRQDENMGPGLARNVGARAATTEFLAFTDADCEVPRNWLAGFASALSNGDYSGATGPYAGSTNPRLLAQLIDRYLAYSQREMPKTIESSISSNLCVRRADFDSSGGFPAYRLPLSKMCYFGNEDEEFAHLLVRRTQKPLTWLSANGVYHGYRARPTSYFRQQAHYAEAIIVSCIRFPAMLLNSTNYSRGGGALKVIVACLALVSLIAAALEPLALVGCLPFLLVNAGTVWFMANSQKRAFRKALYAFVCYPFLLFTSIAWAWGLMRGCVKGVAGWFYWRRMRS